jgi:anti-anti-sigma factor
MSPPQFEHLQGRAEQGVLVLTIASAQVQGDQLAEALREEFFQALDHFQLPKVVVDFQQVKYMGSAGFRPLLSLHRRLRDQGGSMILCNLCPEVEEVLRVTRLVSTSRSLPAPFATAPTVADAVVKLQQD